MTQSQNGSPGSGQTTATFPGPKSPQLLQALREQKLLSKQQYKRFYLLFLLTCLFLVILVLALIPITTPYEKLVFSLPLSIYFATATAIKVSLGFFVIKITHASYDSHLERFQRLSDLELAILSAQPISESPTKLILEVLGYSGSTRYRADSGQNSDPVNNT